MIWPHSYWFMARASCQRNVTIKSMFHRLNVNIRNTKKKNSTRQHLHGVHLNFVSVDQVECKKNVNEK